VPIVARGGSRVEPGNVEGARAGERCYLVGRKFSVWQFGGPVTRARADIGAVLLAGPRLEMPRETPDDNLLSLIVPEIVDTQTALGVARIATIL